MKNSMHQLGNIQSKIDCHLPDLFIDLGTTHETSNTLTGEERDRDRQTETETDYEGRELDLHQRITNDVGLF